MKLHFKSYRFASEVLDSIKYRKLKEEIVNVLENAPVPQLDPPKTRRRGGRTMIFTTDQKTLNEHFKREFRDRGWEVSPRITTNGVTRIEADFKKEGVQIEIQFGNMARWYTDVFKFQVSYSLGLIDVGVLVVPMQSFARTIDENVVYFERVARELPYAKMSITLPILIIGIEPENP